MLTARKALAVDILAVVSQIKVAGTSPLSCPIRTAREQNKPPKSATKYILRFDGRITIATLGGRSITVAARIGGSD